MGANNTKGQATNPKSNYNPQVSVVTEKLTSSHFGDVKVVIDKETEQKLILKEVPVYTKQAFLEEAQSLNNRLGVDHPNVIQIVGYNAQDQQNFCSHRYHISIYIEHVDQTLQAQLEERIALEHSYQEIEILQLADFLISGLSYCQSHDFAHGDIRPLNIFVQDDSYKLSDPYLSPLKGQNALTLAIVQAQKTLLAPELLAQVPQNNFEIKTDKYKADVFSLGLTLLSLATLSNLEDIYNYEEGTINEALLNEKLEKIRSHYAPFTYDLIKTMLTIQEKTRPDFVALSSRLAPYQEFIKGGGYIKIENARRSAAPSFVSEVKVDTTFGNLTNSELEAKIKAILDKCEDTFSAVAARDQTFRDSIVKISKGEVVVATEAPKNTNELAKSYVAPQPGTYTTPGTTATAATYSYTPSTYNYTANTYNPATTYGNTATVEDQKRSQSLVQRVA